MELSLKQGYRLRAIPLGSCAVKLVEDFFKEDLYDNLAVDIGSGWVQHWIHNWTIFDLERALSIMESNHVQE